jgi:hypothetical protein
MKQWFNNFRWTELFLLLSAVSGALGALSQADLSEPLKSQVSLGLTVVTTILSFVRNPKKLDWKEEL